MEQSRRRGHGATAAKALTARILERGQVPYCYIADGNEASSALFAKMGYQQQPQPVFWVMCQGAAPADSSDSDE
jgi:predicted GNAT family acetyltransferase